MVSGIFSGIPLFLSAVAVVLVLTVSGCLSGVDISTGKGTVCFNESCFDVEIADTPEERATGLMHREALDQDKGMLFIFEDSGVFPFWMKNTLIPLDIIWISQDNNVVYISKATRPCLANPCPPVNPGKVALYVLEVNGGISDKIGIGIGDMVTIDLL